MDVPIRRPLVPLALCSATAQATALAMGDGVPPWTGVVLVVVAVCAFVVGRREGDGRPAWAVLLVSLPPTVPLGLAAPHAWATAPLLALLAVLLPWLVGRSARQQAELAVAAAERVHLRERARIAHDAHDLLGHELSLLALRAGALELAADLPERHREAVGELRGGAGAATERLAGLVALLRDGEPPPLRPQDDDLADLAHRASAAGLPVTLTWHGPSPLPPAVAATAHRVVREALTNAAKHAPGAPVRITVTAAEDIVVTVANPVTTRRRAPGSGTGLAALAERVRSAGGALDVSTSGGAFQLTATLPGREER
ncbi:histidine kinase [Actinosynnema pretiosum subsp. pretiosum]|uniref:histidine kinase n=1 Tax=Actinosynnema pretiosum subsp. pretiosum TaxID=103721 RepID=A0AA45L7S8_9PSEU|nr:two component sensor kinase [Actinosynnema pretiosum subsp. pretiosum]QUF04896.1 histidine kinase [Actinosynnema pretiosum subsp. pretiosum]